MKLALLSWIALLLIAPLVAISFIPAATLGMLYVRQGIHMMIEGFCGLNALMIFGMLLFLGLRRKDVGIIFFGFAFLCMGVLDILHASVNSDTYKSLFYLLHTWSALSGSLILSCGVFIKIYFYRVIRFRSRKIFLLIVAIVVLSTLVVATAYNYALPHLIPESARVWYAFPRSIYNMHALAALLYALCAIAFYMHYESHSYVPSLIIGSMLLIFAECAYLFQFSVMWGVTWWLWHGIKMAFYFTTSVTIVVGFLFALSAVESSRSRLVKINLKLRNSERATRVVNNELRARNEMIRATMSSLSIENVYLAISNAANKLLGSAFCEILVNVPKDAVDEFNCLTLNEYKGRITAWAPKDRDSEKSGERSVAHYSMVSGGRAARCVDAQMNFALNANGHEVGRLRITARNGVMLDNNVLILASLSAEAGPAIYNALLYRGQLEDEAFYAGLLRISFSLASTLDLTCIRKRVGHEGARLLQADGAFVWLEGDDGGTEAAICVADSVKVDTSRLTQCRWFRSIRDSCGRHGHRCRPLSAVASVGGGDGSSEWPLDEACKCKALAVFPLLDGSRLIGMVGFVRFDRVRFSEKTIVKGELLAGGVQAAVINMRNYHRLGKINEQLRLAEEARAHHERLAALGEMAASVAHEVRNPLGAISNCLAVLKSANKDAAPLALEAREIIQNEVERINKLTRDFLTFGSRERGITQPVAVDRLLERVRASFLHYLAHEGLDIIFESRYLGERKSVLLDSDRLEMVLGNLLMNAAQVSTRQGRVEALIRLKGNRLLLIVRDFGKGVPPDIRKGMFQPFFSRRERGVGLGLAIVDRYCKDWNAPIRVYSRPGRGTLFAIRIPVSFPLTREPSAVRRKVFF